MILKGRIDFVQPVKTIAGRNGEFESQGLRLAIEEAQPDGSTYRHFLYGRMFGPHLDNFKAGAYHAGEEIEVDAYFSTTERNGYVSCYIEFRNPHRL